MQIEGSQEDKKPSPPTPLTTLTMALTASSEKDQMECTSQSETTNESSGEDKDDGKPKGMLIGVAIYGILGILKMQVYISSQGLHFCS